ncbi:MAG: hypothetical protein KAT58_02880 [candidate division Zixibacteria bacterium]|nr:hypothetical protein [candidate division Zixibacteria bacterium]
MALRKPKYAMKMVVGGEEKEISFEELTLSNKLSQDAVVSLLIKKGVFKGEELLEEIKLIKKERYRSAEKK